MFTPLSEPTHVIDVVPHSVVGHPDPLSTLRYQVRPLQSHQAELYRPSSDYIRHLLNSRRDNTVINTAITTTTPDTLSQTASHHSKPNITSNEPALLAHVKASVRAILGGAKSSNISEEDKFRLQQHQANGDLADHVSRIHSLGENHQDVLQRANGDTAFSMETFEADRVGLDSFKTPADSAARQNVFDLASVFDPNNLKDVELFGLMKDEEEDSLDNEDEDELSHSSLMMARLGLHEKDDTGLDAELDAVIGASYGFWDNRSVLRKGWKSAQKQRSDEDIWASDDKIDVSDFAQLVPDMVIEYPFNLDTFQKRAVYRLERDENVFVAAHTSAGKTVVAEYAIALAMQRKTKVIYTSPIKTLSNQKFRDFTERFGDVGIITGDISINPDAGCLVMTTEILRSMLYKGADLIRDLSHVIFDECHWLNDPERGVVWEESIILLPATVNIVMLSATVPNAMEFAKWVGRTKQKQVFVVSTSKRPVPLSHQLFVKGQVYPLFDSSQGCFLDANYRRAASHHKESTKNATVRFGGGRNHAWMPIIKYLQKRNLDPAIFFCFSKKKCNEAAEQLHAQDLTAGATDKNQIHLFYQSAIARLSANDRNVPQIARHREMLKRGIGVHHAGVLPIIKEITEVLFQRGLIRILFATETFAMGVNMPARTVVFTAIHKFDSQSRRLLEPGEYVQMAGRAGRRGLDDVGTVLLFPSAADFPVESDVKAVLVGTPKPLRSQFRLTYNMILNLLRIDELRVEDVMARSFSEAPAGRTSVTVRKLLQRGSETLHSIHSTSTELERYRALYQLSNRVDSLSRKIGKSLSQEAKNSARSVLGVGRVVLVRGQDHTFRLGVVIKPLSNGRSKGGVSLKGPALKSKIGAFSTRRDGELYLKVLVLCGGPAVSGEPNPFFQHELRAANFKGNPKQYNAGGLVVEIRDESCEGIMNFLNQKIEVNERGLVPIRGDPNPMALAAGAEKLRDLARDEAASFSDLHPVKDLGLQDLDVMEHWEERRHSIAVMNNMISELISSGAIAEVGGAFHQLTKETSLEERLEMLRIATSDESLQLMPDYKQRAEVLRRLGYIDSTSVRLKGRAACEVNTCESIILTELVFEKVLQKLDAADLAALLCSLVFQEKVDGEVTSYSQVDSLREEGISLHESCQSMIAVLSCLGAVQAECGLAISPSEYVRNNANFGFIMGVRAWAKGKTFAEVCEECGGDIPEGSIVRTIVRLCEVLRETKNVGRVIGDPDLQAKAEEAIGLVRRDVIFAASLYVQ